MTTERTQDGMIGSADPRIAFRSGDAPGACYASGRTVYDEIFRAGRLLSYAFENGNHIDGPPIRRFAGQHRTA